MKKSIISMAFVFLLAYALVNQNTGPYSGSYYLKQNSNLILKLNDNNSFTIDIAIGKTSQFTKGKYIIKDNNLVLIPDSGNSDKVITSNLFGKVEGSRIIITNYEEEFIKR